MHLSAVLLAAALGISAQAPPPAPPPRDNLTASKENNVTGCVRDTSGGVLPGAEVVASNPAGEARTVTGASGCYELRGLEAGEYTVSAKLAGFLTTKRSGVVMAVGTGIPGLDFTMCAGPFTDILFVLPAGGLEGAWKAADVVAHVRITATAPVVSSCPTSDVRHAATVVELLKGETGTSELTIHQDQWDEERTPYPVGHELIVFLAARNGVFFRLAGPHYALAVDGNRFSSRLPEWAEGFTVEQFLSKLRALR